MLKQLDHIRLEASARLDPTRKEELGQFMTPSTVADFMASLFSPCNQDVICLLDAGAGVGSLTAAFLDRCVKGTLNSQTVTVTAFEIDQILGKQLKKTLTEYKEHLDLHIEINSNDFIEDGVNNLQLFGSGPRFTHVILNPPYKKIHSQSRYRLILRQVGIETVNLYTGFVALALALMVHHGEIVAIIPRSFCNGPYYRPFREFIFTRAAIRQIHLLDARNKVFRDDGVLQETIIIHLQRGSDQGDVIISTSTDDSFSDYKARVFSFNQIVIPEDPEKFIHIPIESTNYSDELYFDFSYSLSELGIDVSTGPVVDFRLQEYLRDMPEHGTVPLLYPVHFKKSKPQWPRTDTKKPNAIVYSDKTKKLLFPLGFYTVVRRFSSKEEKRRIIASVVEPYIFAKYSFLGFENHLNVFHCNKQGLPEDLAAGLAIYLNSRLADEQFRRFNGHTQVNATDLRMMRYPSRQALIELGQWAGAQEQLTQTLIDQQVESITT